MQSARKKPQERSDQKFASLGYLLDFAVILLPSSWNISPPPEPGGPYPLDPRSWTGADDRLPFPGLRRAGTRGPTCWVGCLGPSARLFGGGTGTGGAARWGARGRRRPGGARHPAPRQLEQVPGRPDARPGTSQPRTLPLGASSPPAAPAPPSSLTPYWPFSPRCRDQKPRVGQPWGGMLREGPEGALSRGHRLRARKKGHEPT